MKTLLIPLTFLLIGCSSLPEEPQTIAGGAPGQIDYCVTVVGANLFCINAKRTLDRQ
jgi:hypothetical protein|tara:strand:- start:97 stop:267 length:171 start_codon:yes stop_codon:yes gene_type:complete